ncbi:MAG: hypothetical protein AAGH67_02790 [Cyanobacteria bacterium P01_H01_bin.162]
MQQLFLALILALWVMVIAIVSVQNATPVAIEFLGLRSVELPVGVVLSFGVAGGLVVTALLMTVARDRRPQR